MNKMIDQVYTKIYTKIREQVLNHIQKEMPKIQTLSSHYPGFKNKFPKIWNHVRTQVYNKTRRQVYTNVHDHVRNQLKELYEQY